MSERPEIAFKSRGSLKSIDILIPFCLMTIPVAAFSVGVAVADARPSPLLMLLIPAGAFAWVRSCRMEIAAGVFSYRSLLAGTRSIRLDEIKTAKYIWSDRSRVLDTIAVEPCESSFGRPFEIPIQVFPISDRLILLGVLGIDPMDGEEVDDDIAL